MRISKQWIYLFLSLYLINYLGCTGNPVTEHEIVLPNRQIRGSVRLSDNLSNEGVYVWLEGFNIGTRTDSQGKFQITLPSQGSPGGITGAFNLFYYVANFVLASTPVFIQNGEFVYSIGEIDSRGELSSPKFLLQNLFIETRVNPSSVSLSDLSEAGDQFVIVRVDVILQAPVDSVIVFFPGLVNDTFGPLIFRNVNNGEISILESTITELVFSDLDTIDAVPTTRIMALKLGRNDLLPGEYEIIPYLLVKEKGVPPLLIASLGERVEELGPNYLNIPFRRLGDNRFLKITD
jgi:hypothetical protein